MIPYNILFTLFLFLYVPYSLLRSLLQKSLRPLLLNRLGFVPNLRSKRPVWIHAASVGEAICSIPLFKRIKRKFPDLPVLVTTMTQAGNSTARALLPEADGFFFLPFDHPLIIRRAVRRIGPRLLLIAETEIWPNLLRCCKKEGVPVLLFNGRISQKSAKGYLAFKSLFRDCLKSISFFLMQTEEDRNRIIGIGAPPGRTKVTGNLKFDQTFPPVTQKEKEAMARSLGLRREDPLLIAGSTHAGEEEAVIGLFKRLKSEIPNLFLVLAPRHLDRLEEVEKILKKEEIPWRRKTSLSAGEGPDLPSVILLDTLGELMRLYSLGTVVFIGGSLVPVGGHNPLEPLAFKKCVLFGPHMFNFLEISRRLTEEEGAVLVEDREDLFRQLRRLLADEGMRTQIGERRYRFLLRHRGATERTFEEIRPFLK